MIDYKQSKGKVSWKNIKTNQNVGTGQVIVIFTIIIIINTKSNTIIIIINTIIITIVIMQGNTVRGIMRARRLYHQRDLESGQLQTLWWCRWRLWQ